MNWLCLFGTLVILVVYCNGQTNKSLPSPENDDKLMESIIKSYNPRIRPIEFIDGKLQSTNVLVNMYLRSLSHVSEANMEYQVQVTFRQSWRDYRLAWGNSSQATFRKYVILTSGMEIWKPDTFFMNEKHAQLHMIDKPNILIRVHTDGLVLYSTRLTMTLSCPMNLRYYPMDVQTCGIQLASYAYTTEDINYIWASDPIQIKSGSVNQLPQFQFTNHTTGYCTSITNTGNYSCLSVEFELTREFGYYLIHLYIPGGALVVVSWVSFWLDPTSVPGRVTLGVTVLLTSHALASGVNAILPPVSYIKSIDVWILSCACFIFAALIEFAIVTYLYSQQLSKHSDERRNIPERKRLLSNVSHTLDAPQNSVDRKIPIFDYLWSQLHEDARIVDRYARVVFPLAFFVFNIFYWLKYTRERFD
uniref:Ig-like domain-containing protein n=1 Tax=Panagrellus redivivus TaxID=6233 RepID=A0A7E4UV26_PANRE